MKRCISVLIFSCLSNISLAVEVTATGYGKSYDEALQSAKVSAVESAAGTFVTGKRELINNKFNETLGQYNGGSIQQINVKSVDLKAGIYIVTISANVNTDKVNKIVVSGNQAVNDSLPKIERIIADQKNTVAGWDAINEVSNPFSINVVAMTDYKVMGSEVLMTYHLQVVFNPKWIDDIKQMVKTINQPIDSDTKHAICGYIYTSSSPQWCGGVSVLPDLPDDSIKCLVTIHYKNGSTELLPETYMSTAPIHKHYYRHKISTGWFSEATVDSLLIGEGMGAPNTFLYQTSVSHLKSISHLSFKLVD